VKAKKPLLLILLTMILLAVALILPAAAWGKPAAPPDNQPKGWVTYASGVREPVHEMVTATVKQLSDGTTVGRMQFKLFYEAAVMTSVAFRDDYTAFYRDGNAKVAVFVALVHYQPTDGPDGYFWMKFKWTDGGQPYTKDIFESWIGDPDANTWDYFPFPGPEPIGPGAITVHVRD
jgi:hypothetical protein